MCIHLIFDVAVHMNRLQEVGALPICDVNSCYAINSESSLRQTRRDLSDDPKVRSFKIFLIVLFAA